jgi:hypothetical protein
MQWPPPSHAYEVPPKQGPLPPLHPCAVPAYWQVVCVAFPSQVPLQMTSTALVVHPVRVGMFMFTTGPLVTAQVPAGAMPLTPLHVWHCALQTPSQQ